MIEKVLPALIPFLQSMLWIGLILWLLRYFKEDISMLLNELRKRVTSGQEIELGPIKLGKIEQKVTAIEKDVNITKQFLLSMSEPMFFNLEKISSGKFGSYDMESGSGLQRELYHLRDIGYIHVDSIRNIPKHGEQLSEHVTISPIGAQFVELRNAYFTDIAMQKN